MLLPDSILLYILLVVAVSVGFLLGRREKRVQVKQQFAQDGRQYYQGLNLLLSDKPELGIDKFVESIEISEHSLDTHLAMGALARRRGEIDKAIHIHQSVLAAPNLSAAHKKLVELELAGDYRFAGLFDRAESILLRLSEQRGEQRIPALVQLLEIYEQERDWENAIITASKLPQSRQGIRVHRCHFNCELADVALRDVDLDSARAYVKAALECDPTQARVHWLTARVELGLKRYKRVQRALQKAAEIDPYIAGEFAPLYLEAAHNIGNTDAYERFLRDCIHRFPHSDLVRALIEHLDNTNQTADAQAIWKDIEHATSAQHLQLLLEIGQEKVDVRVRSYVDRIVEQSSKFQCSSCGFASQSLMWHCPTCRSWSSFTSTERSDSMDTQRASDERDAAA